MENKIIIVGECMKSCGYAMITKQKILNELAAMLKEKGINVTTELIISEDQEYFNIYIINKLDERHLIATNNTSNINDYYHFLDGEIHSKQKFLDDILTKINKIII
jgi:hypothetical protein